MKVSYMDRKKKANRKCGRAGCLTDPVMCKPWMCPDYVRGES